MSTEGTKSKGTCGISPKHIHDRNEYCNNWQPLPPLTCTYCHGNKRVYEHVQDDTGIPCPRCNGTGVETQIATEELIVKSTSGLSFKLGEFIMQELVDPEPYILLRGALGEALAILRAAPATDSWFTYYVIGSNIGQYKAEVEWTPDLLRIGCVTFKGDDAETVKAWALKHVPNET